MKVQFQKSPPGLWVDRARTKARNSVRRRPRSSRREVTMALARAEAGEAVRGLGQSCQPQPRHTAQRLSPCPHTARADTGLARGLTDTLT